MPTQHPDCTSIATARDSAADEFPPAHLLLQWHITERCILRCLHCYQADAPSDELDWPTLLRILDQFRELRRQILVRRPRKQTRFHISITGGEPFIRDDALPLLEAIASERDAYSLAVLCNGMLIDDTLARRLAGLRLSYVQVSIDGSESTHDRTRGQGAYARAVAGIRHLTRHGVPVMLAFTATRDNCDEFADVARLGKQLGVRRVWADRCVPLGRAGSNEALGPEETLRLFRSMQHEAETARRERSRTEIAMHRALQFLLTGAQPYRCTAGTGLLTVMANGDVCPCRRMPVVAGNILSESLSDLYWGSVVLNQLRAPGVSPVGCERCFYSKTCRGGLRCLAAATYGDPFAADPGCWLQSRRRDAEALDEMTAKVGVV
ncbi:MAG: radical SAM protein [Candidatus Hydrogenedentales bacterium]|jgi:radical SAM protein with 4Fe4S-binding SPASM domain